MQNNTCNISVWTPFQTLITAITTNPSLGSGAVLTSYYMQIGKLLNIQVFFTQSNAGSAGSGMYLFSIPSGYTINTAITPVFNASVGYSTLGNFIGLFPGESPNVGGAMCYDSTHYVIYALDEFGDEAFIGSSYFGLNNTPLNYSLTLFVPVL